LYSSFTEESENMNTTNEQSINIKKTINDIFKNNNENKTLRYDSTNNKIIIKGIKKEDIPIVVKGYDTNKIMFSEPILGSIPGTRIEFKKINISIINDDGSVGGLIIPTSRLFSFGVSENISQETGKINGYTFPLCLWNKDGHSEEEKEWTDLFDKIVDKCIDHLVENKEEIDMFDLTRSDLIKSKGGGLNPLYWKKEKHTNDKGKTEMRNVPNSGPTIYTKLFSKKNLFSNDKVVLSQFYNVNYEPINALDLIGKYCYTNATIKIESIFIGGSKISLQVMLYEAIVEPIKQIIIDTKTFILGQRVKYKGEYLCNIKAIHNDGDELYYTIIFDDTETEKQTIGKYLD
jgi:hypothetical protein